MQKSLFAFLEDKKYKNIKIAYCKLIKQKKFKHKQSITKTFVECKNSSELWKAANLFRPRKAQVGRIESNQFQDFIDALYRQSELPFQCEDQPPHPYLYLGIT